LEEGPIEQLGAWLYTVARHRIIDGYRKRRTATLEALAPETDTEEGFWDVANLLPEDDTDASESWRRMFWMDLHAALAELPEPQRQVFIWQELEGLSFQEIAGRTGENLNTLLSRKRYAVRYLRQRLEAWHENSSG
jgi:RNA polymerase sigma factor (sigma-70 family)